MLDYGEYVACEREMLGLLGSERELIGLWKM